MRVKRAASLITLVVFAASGCDDGQPDVDQSKKDVITSYRQVASSGYVETVKLVIRSKNQVEYEGFLLDPFSNEKLKIGIEGVAEYDGDSWYILKSQDSLHKIDLYYRFVQAGDLECTLLVSSEESSTYSGQWSFSAESKK
jgi:hypothetical protein